jgi:hypothetical protein
MRAHGIGKESVVADPDEAAGQDVKEKAAEEGGGVECGESGGRYHARGPSSGR